MKKIALVLVLVLLISSFAGCSADTFTVNSTSDKFKLRNVSSITLYGPDATGESSEGIQIELTPDGGIDYTRLMQIIQGKKLDECPTRDFGLCYISFTFTSGDVTKVYPANDGSNYVCLYSLNEDIAKYLELPQADMEELVKLVEKYDIQVDYS